MQYEYEECSSDLGESDSSNSSDRSEGRDISSKSRGTARKITGRTPQRVRTLNSPPTLTYSPKLSKSTNSGEWKKWVLSTSRYQDALNSDCGCAKYFKGCFRMVLSQIPLLDLQAIVEAYVKNSRRAYEERMAMLRGGATLTGKWGGGGVIMHNTI
jgi:hypothetical protein